MAVSFYNAENIMGKSYTNPVLNIRMNQVEFTKGEIMELTTNFIKRNKYLLLDALVDYCKDNKASFLSEQYIKVHG